MPARTRCAADSAPIEPAPMTTAVRPASPSSRVSAMSSATDTTEAPAASIPVSECTRLPTDSARCASSCRVRPTVWLASAAAYARRTWPSTCCSPITAESSPLVTANRCSTAASA